ncbi:hypothetical protein D2962_05960 [Biomaibacter acetigenes]|uniref:Uncharacterized protein n=1 Tax=Biomaibacter acetigenes TaxID=2316383 RepID=A0A3G2R4A4_9FIRM|nr:hypothetical protein [Biomaibacter acetigenes]AYO30222.1 hypothetical protein D2962_05960 [Biomaibacter acetigenes]
MFKVKSPTKKLKEICSKLGPDYSIKVIDAEQVIYRKINDNYELEVSGLNNSRKKMKAVIYLWQLKPGKVNLEVIENVTTFEFLESSLTSLVEKYRNSN